MDLNLVEPEDIPVPPADVRIRGIAVEPLADSRRVRVSVRLTPFLERPTIELAILAPDGETVSRTTVVEADQPEVDLTMHLRSAPTEGRYVMRGSLAYGSEPAQDVRETHFSLSEA